MIGICTRCSKSFDASEERANEPGRLCKDCWDAERAPKPDTPGKLDVLVAEVLISNTGRGNASKIFGKWPGDETDEEIDRALEELS